MFTINDQSRIFYEYGEYTYKFLVNVNLLFVWKIKLFTNSTLIINSRNIASISFQSVLSESNSDIILNK